MSNVRSAVDETDQKGSFQRTASVYRDFIKKGGPFEPEPNRYHLYISYACPWACRCLATIYLKGLDHIIGFSVVHPTWARTKPDDPNDAHCGWAFRAPTDPPVPNTLGHGSFDCTDCIPDNINGAKNVRELYEIAKDTGGKFTVPILWDKKHKTIVNNESSEIMIMLNKEFNEFAKNPSLDLYPENLVSQIEELNTWIYPQINNGVYRCGFAVSQGAYETAFNEVFSGLDRLEDILSKQKYLCGGVFTAADLKLFVTLIRFDEVYVVYFKTNKKRIQDYPNLFNYIKDIYQIPGIAKSVNMKHIKTHYFTSHPKLNTYGIIPVGNPVDYNTPHDRSRFDTQ
eukprot:TRINITY_DN6565_c0_g1_i1.p1 TRINITY_DN6565_c0_g1~~TRINITY_DN6565_c0_g1_i1.p1  ORF type:complete len:341 (+),score=64.90 TRINITY_DN6565_c0_g1_i1:37-1059(+)